MTPQTAVGHPSPNGNGNAQVLVQPDKPVAGGRLLEVRALHGDMRGRQQLAKRGMRTQPSCQRGAPRQGQQAAGSADRALGEKHRFDARTLVGTQELGQEGEAQLVEGSRVHRQGWCD
jgi:hypothetical protein